ncbi:MAG: hypothetical protein HQ567_07815 [Candidatus Nealsonbacteria bacterium]|nr:hypothetical protein [Candidatus Nealsonbacteria bacterium]
MDLIGSFSFGQLIKTFLPGFIALLGVSFYVDLLSLCVFNHSPMISFIKEEPLAFLGFAIPFSVILGGLSNTVNFLLLIPWLIVRHFRENHRAICELESNLERDVIEDVMGRRQWSSDRAEVFRKHVNARALMLHKVDLEKVLYVKDSFWPYLEFQVNLLLCGTFSFPGAIAFLIVLQNHAQASLLVMITALVLGVLTYACLAAALICAARRNYYYYQIKYISLLINTWADDGDASASDDVTPIQTQADVQTE